MQNKCLGDAVNNGGQVLPVTLSSPCWVLSPGSRSGLVEVRGGSLPWPTPWLGSRLPSPLSLTFAALATAKQQARPKTSSSQRPMVCGCLCDTCPRSLRVFMGLQPAQSCLQRDPSPPPVIGPSSRLAALQVVYLGPGDSCCFQRGSGWARVTCRHTHHTHTRAGWSVFPRARCSRVTWSPQGTCADDAYLGAQADGRAAGRAGAQGLELGWARSALTEDLLLPLGKWARFVPVP